MSDEFLNVEVLLLLKVVPMFFWGKTKSRSWKLGGSIFSEIKILETWLFFEENLKLSGTFLA